MTFIELSQVLGNFGEFFGAIAVVGTLIFLSIQVQHSKRATEANTRSMDESRRLAMAQTYQARAFQSEEALRSMAGSDEWPSLLLKIGGWGYEGDASGLDDLSAVERERMRLMQLGRLQQLDNLHYQHQKGYLDDDNVVNNIRMNARYWRGLGIWPWKPSFRTEVERILAEE